MLPKPLVTERKIKCKSLTNVAKGLTDKTNNDYYDLTRRV